MKTAVQLRDDRADDLPRCDLLWGSPSAEVLGALGLVALFDAGELVAYRLVHARRVRVFVFRTLAAHEPYEASVPGVRPAVHLLLQLRTAGRARLFARLLNLLVVTGANPASLTDEFFRRAGAALSGRLTRAGLLADLSRQAPSYRTELEALQGHEVVNAHLRTRSGSRRGTTAEATFARPPIPHRRSAACMEVFRGH